MTKLHELNALGQSIWLDYIRRSFLASGELQRWIDQGLRGVTSNPSIFEKAIAGSQDYGEDLRRLALEGRSTGEIFEALVVSDIRQAADLLRPVFEESWGTDGFVSLEVNPALAYDTQATLQEARLLWSNVDRPNLMVKIPATEQGIPAIAQAIAEGININITLIFSRTRYGEVISAYLQGLQQRLERGLPVGQIASVASFFVSRVDTKVDRLLESIVQQEGRDAGLAASLLGVAGVANARLAYQQFKEVFEGEAFARLKAEGAQVQRPLWASTSTKNPAYSDIKYVQELIGPYTVNTVPEETLEAFLDYGEVRSTLEGDLDEQRRAVQSLADLGISLEQVTQELEDEGVAAFAKSYEALIDAIRGKREQLQTGGRQSPPTSPRGEANPSQRPNQIEASLPNRGKLDAALAEMEKDQIIERIWRQDHTVWRPDPAEIANRLGWLHIAEEIESRLPQLEAFVYAVQEAGYTQILLLGMGGSSLAPELFSRSFPGHAGISLEILDSTDPGAVLAYTGKLNPAKTLFIVSTKSGTTVETLSAFKYFYNWTAAALGEAEAGDHFTAITDPDSYLADLAQRYRFRATFLNDPNIGGRYSALSFFGLVPAALYGVDLTRLLARARAMAEACQPEAPVRENPAAQLGAILGELAIAGQDKVTLILSPSLLSFGDWVEQLIAESTGKEGRGILPVVREPLGPPAVYGKDRLFVHIRLEGDEDDAPAISHLEDSGFPVVHLWLQDIYDLGGQLFLWELATAIAGYRLGINPFDQPNVESAKKGAREMVEAYSKSGKLPEEEPLLSQDGIAVYGPREIEGFGVEWHLRGGAPGEVLAIFLTQSREGDYIALQAFIEPTEENFKALNELRVRMRDRYHLATTSGFGPRFLHSTGQLHKGDAGNGIFIQFTADNPRDVPIPDEAGNQGSSMSGSGMSGSGMSGSNMSGSGMSGSNMSFGVLELAQAMGDRKALLDAGRRVIRFHFHGDPASSLSRLTVI